MTQPSDVTSPLTGAQLEARDAGSIPGYELLELVHRGGQGAVYRALQLGTGRLVALKLLPSRVHASVRERRRFARERDILATLDHPSVVALIDAGDAGDHPFLVMRYVEGLDLDKWARRVKPDPARAARVMVAICAGVEHAHARGILHRDIKPSNVRMDADGNPHVLDFGLAAPLRLEGEEASSLTVEGVFLGTLAFAAPEQLRADASQVDVRTDVHGLGVLLFFLLTGELPHAPSSDLVDALARISREEPRSPRDLVPELDTDLDTIARKAVARDPARRYQTVQQLRGDLSRWLEGEAIEARRDSRFYVLRKAARRHARALAAAGAVFAILLAALASVASQRDAARRSEALAVAERERAVRESERARVAADTSRRVADVLAGLVSLGPSMGTARAAGQATVADAVLQARERVLPELEDDPEVHARIAGVLGSSLASLGRWSDAEPLLLEAVEHYRREPGIPIEMVRAVTNLARHHGGLGRYEEAEHWYREAAAMARRSRGELRADVLPKTLVNLANELARAGCASEAHALLAEALSIAQADLPEDASLALTIAMRLPHEPTRGFEHELAHSHAMLERLRPLVPPGDLIVSDTLEALGVHALRNGRPDLALPPLAEGLELRQTLLRSPHPFIAEARANLGTCLVGLGDDSGWTMMRQAWGEYLATGTESSNAARLTKASLDDRDRSLRRTAAEGAVPP